MRPSSLVSTTAALRAALRAALVAALVATLTATLPAQQPTAPATPPTPAAPTRPAAPAPTLRLPAADTGIFSPVALPPATDVRGPNGAPGPRYWQQRADYDIKATLDTAAKRLAGTETIRYTNNSPDTLRFVWLQLDQNLFKPGSTGSLLNPQESRFGGAGFQGGFEISSVTQSGDALAVPPVRRRPGQPGPAVAKTTGSSGPLKSRVDDTMMYVELARPLAPGATTTLAITYAFNIPEHGADRMGRDGSLYELAQWYPRMAVYDDVHGWNTLQYLGQGEFYLEYGNFTYEVTVPAGYIVAGSGILQNAAEVLTATQRARLAQAVKSDTTIHIITQDELASGAARPTGARGTLTWKFKADSVRDVAWAGAPNYLWDASGYNGTVAQAYYRPESAATWKDGAKMSRFSIKEYSERWFPYPYPQISAVEGPVSGMEYPMVAMEAPAQSLEELYNVVTHEIGHMWYPMTVGSDERRYAWMDEGFNTFINTFSEEDYWHRSDRQTRLGETQFVIRLDQTPTAQPIMTPANRYLNNNNLGSLAYVKPSIVLLALRNKVLGPDVFDAAFREYTRRWAFKHPQPADFFRTMENVSGEDLSWFWRGFFFTTDALDQAVESVASRPQGNGFATDIVLRNLGQAVMPVELEVTFADGSTQLLKYPVEIWYGGDRYTVRLMTDKQVTAARVNPDGTFPDVVPQNNGAKTTT
jgi:hypothetical protein